MEQRRNHGLDTLRGVTLISMMAYHACWDLVYLYGLDWAWYRSDWAYLWQQSICWTFILLSGYCLHLGRHRLKRGLMAFGGGLAVSLATIFFMDGTPILFGVLTFLGSATLLAVPLDRPLKRIPAGAGLAVSFVLFLLLRDVNSGFLGFEGIRLAALPRGLYRNFFTAWLGFPPAWFSSSDYFSLLPWLFLFFTGYYLYPLLPARRSDFRLPAVTFLGRHSLLTYLAHQPVIYAVLAALDFAGIL